MAGMMPADDGTWRTQAFRQNMVSKIEEAILQCGAPTSKNAAEMENQVFSKANSKNEYLSFVARLIIHIKDMGSKKMGGPGGQAMGAQPNQPQQGGGGGQMVGSIGGGQQNMGMMGQMNQINSLNQMNQMNTMNPQGMQQQQQQMNQGMQQGGMNMPQQQQQQQQQQQTPQQNNIPMGQPGQQMQGQGGGQMMNPNFMNQAQIQQQMQQNPGMNNAVQGQQMQQQMPNSTMGTPQQQQQMQIQNQMTNPQMQQQMQQAMMQQQQVNQQQLQQQQQQQQQVNQQHIQQQATQQQLQQQQQANQQQLQQQQQQQTQQPQMNMQQQQMMQARGMVNNQMVQGRMMGPQGTMSNQLTAMAQQRKVAQNRPGGPNAMGIPRPEHGPNYAMNRVNYYGANMAQVENAGMGNQYPGVPGGSPMQRPPGSGGQFLPPTPSQGMSMGPSPSPNSMNVPGQGVLNQPGLVNSPQSHSMLHGHGSPAGPGVNTMRAFPSMDQMVPSPNTNLNTPMPSAPTPSPRNAEDQACMEKIKELKKYTDLLQRMIAKIGNEDIEKSSKMKKLLEILTNPNQRVSMEILLKCEAALKKMERQQHDAGGVMGPASQPMPTKDQISPFQQIQDAILTALKNGSSSHTFLRTFRPTVEALTGQSSGGSESPDDSDCSFDGELTCDIPWVLQRELKILDHRFHVRVNKSKYRPLPLQLTVSLADEKLPRVPPLKLEIPSDYPEESPSVNDLTKEYSSTPFLTSVAQALKSRLLYLPERFTVLELLNCWEMSVRQVSNPHPYRRSIGRRRISGRGGLAISFI